MIIRLCQIHLVILFKLRHPINEKQTFQLFDVVGKLVIIKEIASSGIINLDTNSLKVGLYTYRIQNNNKQTLRIGKLIKQ